MSALEQVLRVGCSETGASSAIVAFTIREKTDLMAMPPSRYLTSNETVFIYSEAVVRALSLDAGIPEVTLPAREMRAIEKARREPGRILFAEVLRENGLS